MPFDPHNNIFYYYRGPSSKTNESIYDKQVEDNTTKALINIVDNGSIEFVSYILKVFNYSKQINDRPRVALQVSKEDSRPDAVIKIGLKNIYIESKVSAVLELNQLERHLKNIDKKDSLVVITGDNEDKKQFSNLDIFHLYWSDIYVHIKKYETKEKLDKFLQKEFLKYLEVIGMAGFTGFNNDDFDCFLTYEEDYKQILKNKLKQFVELIYSVLDKEVKSKYSNITAGAMKKGGYSFWSALKKNEALKDVFSHCNFTVELNAEALMINTVIRDGTIKDKKPIGILHKKVSSDKKEFLKVLKSLSKDFYIRIFSRTGANGGKIMPGSEIWNLVSIVSLEYVNEELVNYLLKMLEEIPYPGLHIGVSLPRGDEKLFDVSKLIKYSSDAINKSYAVLKYLES